MTLVQCIVSIFFSTFCLNQFRELMSRSSMMIQTCRFNHKMVSRRLLQNKILSSKVVTRSTTMIVHDCPMTSLNIVTPRLHGYETYVTSNDSRFNKKHLGESPHTMQMIFYLATCHFLCPGLVFKALPCWPPYGFIMNGLAMIIISVIFWHFTLRAWVRMLQFSKRRLFNFFFAGASYLLH